jgi:hypothetical protein
VVVRVRQRVLAEAPRSCRCREGSYGYSPSRVDSPSRWGRTVPNTSAAPTPTTPPHRPLWRSSREPAARGRTLPHPRGCQPPPGRPAHTLQRQPHRGPRRRSRCSPHKESRSAKAESRHRAEQVALAAAVLILRSSTGQGSLATSSLSAQTASDRTCPSPTPFPSCLGSALGHVYGAAFTRAGYPAASAALLIVCDV